MHDADGQSSNSFRVDHQSWRKKELEIINRSSVSWPVCLRWERMLLNVGSDCSHYLLRRKHLG